MKRALALAAFGTALSACHPAKPSPAPAAQERATLFVLADLRGYLGPCGCSEAMRGGIARAGHAVAEARRSGAPVAVVEAGDSLFDRGDLAPGEVPETERRAKALAEAFAALGVSAKANGPRDDARGADFRKALGLPDVASGTARLLSLAGHAVGFAAGADAEALRKAAESARAQGAEWVVGALALPLAQAQREADALRGLVDLVIAARAEGELDAEENRVVNAGVPLVQLQSKGRSLLRVDFVFGPAPGAAGRTPLPLLRTAADAQAAAEAIDARLALLSKQLNAPGIAEARAALLREKQNELVARRHALLATPPPTGARGFALRFVPLESSLPGAPELTQVVERYDRDVGALNLAWAKTRGKDCAPPSKGEAAVVGTAACLACHPETERVWRESKHAHAWATLEGLHKQLHTQCIGCHVTGYGQPGGVCRLDKVAGRENVGCESCHGPGSSHADDPSPANIVAKPAEGRCAGCHTQENSPHFDFALYRPRILGPGHGAPLARPNR